MSGGGFQSNFFPNRPGINLSHDSKDQQDGYHPKPILKKVLCLYIFNDTLFYMLLSILSDIMMHYKRSLFSKLFLLEGFNFKQEDRFDCGVKAGDAFASQRRFPQQLYWDFKVHLYKL